MMFGGFRSVQKSAEMGYWLRQGSVRKHTTEIAVVTAVNADRSYDVEIRASGASLAGVQYEGTLTFKVFDPVTVIFFQNDVQKPRIVGPGPRDTNNKVVDVEFNF